MANSSKYKKCLVLDLDNTLWGGVVGEDGVGGIQLGLSEPGSHYLAFQQAVLDLHGRGIILALASRNNVEDAMNVIENHPNQLLKKNHFAALRLNWQNKAENIIDIAKELNIGLDSIVFLDDDPVNRNHVREILPEVEVPDMPLDSGEYVKFLNSLNYFPLNAITDEDKMRGNLYVTERLRKESENRAVSREVFLDQLGLELIVGIDDENAAARIAQLTEKTNQFNFFKSPLQEETVRDLMGQPDYKIVYARVIDKFGDNGITNVAILKKLNETTWQIEQFLMSCRVIGRGIEQAFLSAIGDEIHNLGGKEIQARFEKSAKNAPGEEFYNTVFKGRRINVDSIEQPKWVKIRKQHE